MPCIIVIPNNYFQNFEVKSNNVDVQPKVKKQHPNYPDL